MALLCVVAICLSVGAGCGAGTAEMPAEAEGGGGALASQAGEDAVSESAEAGEMQTLKVGMAGKDIKTVCIIVAQEMGYYKEEGVEVQFETISNLADGLTAVDMGKLDILPFGVIPSASFVAQGADVVVFGGTISEGSEIVTLPENAASIQSLEDFRGKKIGCYRMETGHMVMKGLLREAGFDLEKDVEFVLLDGQPTIIEAVKKGEVDMGFLNSGQGYVAQQAGLAVARQVAEFEPDFPCCRQTTSRAALEEKRDALIRFQVANLRAYKTLMEDPDRVVEALAVYSGQPEEYVRAVIFGVAGEYESAMRVSLDPNKNKVLSFYELMKDNGDIDPETEYDMADHIDTSIYEDALTEMLEREPDSEVFQALAEEFAQNNR